jgi:urate oxidase
MSVREQLDSEIYSLLKNIENQTIEDQRKTIILFMDKYIHLFSAPILLDKHDFDMVKSHAHAYIMEKAFPKYLGSKRREVSGTEANVLAIIEGTIIVLNSKECFKKLPKFDYRG